MSDTRRHGALRDRFRFQSRGTTGDGWGNNNVPGGSYVDEFVKDVNLRPRTGGESVIALRLQGVQPYVATVRWSRPILAISTTWRLVDVRDTGRILKIVSPPSDPDGKRQWLEFLVTEGTLQ